MNFNDPREAASTQPATTGHLPDDMAELHMPRPSQNAAAPAARIALNAAHRNDTVSSVAELLGITSAHASYRSYPTHVRQFVAWARERIDVKPAECTDLELVASASHDVANAYLSYLVSHRYSKSSVMVKFAALKKVSAMLSDGTSNDDSPWRFSDSRAAGLKPRSESAVANPEQVTKFLSLCARNVGSSHVFGTAAALISVAAASHLRSSRLLKLPHVAIVLNTEGKALRIKSEFALLSRSFTDEEANAVSTYLEWRQRLIVAHGKSGGFATALWLTSDCEPLHERTANRTIDRIHDFMPALSDITLRSVRNLASKENPVK